MQERPRQGSRAGAYCQNITIYLSSILSTAFSFAWTNMERQTHKAHVHTLSHLLNCSWDFYSCFKQTVFLNTVGEPSEKESPISHQTSHCVADNTFKESFVATHSHPHTHAHINTYTLKRGQLSKKNQATIKKKWEVVAACGVMGHVVFLSVSVLLC